jgi:hypothetical protein
MVNPAPPSHYELCFRSLFNSGRGFAFPCNARGEVHLDGLSERARNNYFYARAMVGRELAPPTVAQHAATATPRKLSQADPWHSRALAGRSP